MIIIVLIIKNLNLKIITINNVRNLNKIFKHKIHNLWMKL